MATLLAGPTRGEKSRRNRSVEEIPSCENRGGVSRALDPARAVRYAHRAGSIRLHITRRINVADRTGDECEKHDYTRIAKRQCHTISSHFDCCFSPFHSFFFKGVRIWRMREEMRSRLIRE